MWSRRRPTSRRRSGSLRTTPALPRRWPWPAAHPRPRPGGRSRSPRPCRPPRPPRPRRPPHDRSRRRRCSRGSRGRTRAYCWWTAGAGCWAARCATRPRGPSPTRWPPTWPASRTRRRGPPSCSPSAPGPASPPKERAGTCISPRPPTTPCCSWYAIVPCRWAGSPLWPSAPRRRRGAGWSASGDRHRGNAAGSRARDPRARRAGRDARVRRRRARRRRALDGGAQGAGGGRARREPGGPPGARHGSGRGRPERLLALAGERRGAARGPYRVRDAGGRGGGGRRERRARAAGAVAGGGGAGMTTRAVEAWTLEPLAAFVKEAGVRLVLLMTSAGQVLAQHGFARAVDVMSAAALGVAIMATTEELARQLGQPPFAAVHHQGERRGIFLASVATGRGPLVALVVYDLDVSSLGLVQLFFEQLAADLAAASPKPSAPGRVLAADFERELRESLNALFGR